MTTLVLVRHGESEANIVNKAIKKKELESYPENYLDMIDREFRLTDKGRSQTVKTGLYLNHEYLDGFDDILTSDFVRAKETAALVCKNTDWESVRIRVEPKIGERNWGTFNTLTLDKQSKFFELKKKDPLHIVPPGGETMLHTRMRALVILENIFKNYVNKRVLIFSHGEFIEAVWAEIANMRTEEQSEFFHSPAGNIGNCQVIEFKSFCNQRFSKVRSSNPDKDEFGDWSSIDYKTFSPDDLLNEVSAYPVRNFILEKVKSDEDLNGDN